MFVYLNNFKFLIGRYEKVFSSLVQSSKKNFSQIILPCSLNDLALSDQAKSYNDVDICVSDSMFLTWWFSIKYKQKINRVYGPDLFISMLDFACDKKLKLNLIASNEKISKLLFKKLKLKYPNIHFEINVFNDFSIETEDNFYQNILKKQPQIIFIGVGSPKQIEIAKHLKKTLKCSTIFCVGAAFDFFSGTKKQAPTWIRKIGLEWFFRLITEPKRLWKRYIFRIPRYLFTVLFNSIFKKNDL